ncbi:hypothetical protein HGO21_13890 [Acinetobacter sp. CUI P1]|nr:hypothetical protein [Acinetobacter sp. CUI P1]
MRILKIGVIVILLLSITGCWSSKVELDELTFVYGMFIDEGKEPNTVEIIVHLSAFNLHRICCRQI